jgi:7,8-dihydropterin-6-yl-methyl-4-(beta-D-ribofuranosyl)aminobenzene 5'-phosphate synthase
MQFSLSPVERVEIVTLEDNYIDLLSLDNTDLVTRAVPLRGLELSNSVIAEHGFSALVRTTLDGQARTMIFDFGFSQDVVVRNAEALSLDLSQVQEAALSHGHIDHFGGLEAVAERIGNKGTRLVLHPAAYKKGRYIEPLPGVKVVLPGLEASEAQAAGFSVVTTAAPHAMLDHTVLFLGEIPKKTEFEVGMPNAFFENQAGEPTHDLIEDDTALAVHLSGKGLVVLSGCAHAGIINTVQYAQKVTGIDKVHVVMGGFHLSGPALEKVIAPTIKAMKEIAPDYVVPTHCTGRRATMSLERELPESFVLNMAGTTLTFVAD